MGQAASSQRDVHSVPPSVQLLPSDRPAWPLGITSSGSHVQDGRRPHPHSPASQNRRSVASISNISLHRRVSRVATRLFTLHESRNVTAEQVGNSEEARVADYGPSPDPRSPAALGRSRDSRAVRGTGVRPGRRNHDYQGSRDLSLLIPSLASIRPRQSQRDAQRPRPSTMLNTRTSAQTGYSSRRSGEEFSNIVGLEPTSFPPSTSRHRRMSRLRNSLAHRLDLNSFMLRTDYRRQSVTANSELGTNEQRVALASPSVLAEHQSNVNEDFPRTVRRNHQPLPPPSDTDLVGGSEGREAPLMGVVHSTDSAVDRDQELSSDIQTHPLSSTSQDGEPPLLSLMTAAVMALTTRIVGGQEPGATSPTTNSPAHTLVDFDLTRHILQQIQRTRARATDTDQNETISPFNSLRVFRLGGPLSASFSPSTPHAMGNLPESTTTTSTDLNLDQAQQEAAPAVTILVVAIHSPATDHMPMNTENTSDPPSHRATLNAMVNLPPLSEASNVTHGPFTDAHDSNERGSRFSHLRRASHHMSTSNLGWLSSRRGEIPALRFPSSIHSARDSILQGSAITSPDGSGDSPPGPFPPPSTPAEHTRSAVSSQPTTPSRRPSIASIMRQSPIADANMSSDATLAADTGQSTEHNLRFARHRRRSESDSVRYRNFGAGAARRNGVVEPDRVEADGRRGRNWLIYVVGTNISQIQPTWATSSLFSEVSLLILICKNDLPDLHTGRTLHTKIC